MTLWVRPSPLYLGTMVMTVALQGKLSSAKDRQTTNPEVENNGCSALPILLFGGGGELTYKTHILLAWEVA